MRFRSLQILVATIAALTLSSYIVFETSSPTFGEPTASESTKKDEVLMQVLINSLKSSHYSPKQINDEFSEDVFDLYLKRLDYAKRFLLEEDVQKLSKHKSQIDDAIKTSDYEFFDLSFEILTKRVKESRSYYEELLSESFDYSEGGQVELDGEKRGFQSTKKELKALWSQLLKYQMMARIHEMEKKQEETSADNDTMTIRSFEQVEAKARKSLSKSNQRFFDRMEKWNRDDLKEVYLNSIMNVFGPHTGYFPPKDKENFDISMSGQLEGIGAQLQEKDGYIKVTRIVPGSASYRQGELEEGDMILKVAQATDAPVDVVDMRLDEAVKLIRGKKGTEVRLTIKKISGQIKEISIIRDIVVLAETYAKSAILQNETGDKIGYIKLPKFYADFNKTGGRSAAKDVKIELEKLKSEKVDGVILDLRGNGGGSLRDAIQMTGHFVKQGPVVQVKGRYTKPEVKKDNDMTVVYDGPLIVMINHFSASASEILAAAIQDYDRGIIMGSRSSFGKGTVQRFLELDRALTAADRDLRPLGALKVTTQKFYRINGDATQIKGVGPDIMFPDQYNHIDIGEKEHDHVMEWDEIPAASYTVWNPTYNEEDIIVRSKKRIQGNSVMNKIDENGIRLKAESEQTVASLKYDEYVIKQMNLEEQEKEFKDMLVPIESLLVSNLASDLEDIQSDTIKVDINEKWMKKLKKDVQLNEAVLVASEMNSAS
ncbi:MAG: carboxy terminal-processing peptidase [Flavobacteriales bacterium]|nr:carboxy terminal-processing peptidase [Flavobacteriales bacterium]MBT3963984.1 carboxy terminal-processing peptidase [Flavobacteriales bacterium]MBT4703909.1 carboxy terminal-processing peptidase [Flavobacteriales bacterium]MBT4931036.1 carboxy terminal-processing peptidase [Flavobacteriales bacterium]MBT5133556.1 carboxy terminal-processing peptidase [Flavobacteriales bacterium]